MKLTKVLLGTTFAVPSLVVPLTTMTSCSQSWGNKTPFLIGSDNILDDDNPYCEFFTGTPYIDADGKQINYMQSNYAVQPAKNAAYAYSAPMEFKDESEEEAEVDGWKLSNCGWYTSYDGVFPRSAIDKQKDPEGKIISKTVSNARNASLAPNIDFIASIGSGINNYISAALQYQSSLIRIGDKETTEKNLGIAWGTMADVPSKFSHGTIDDPENTKFFEFICSLANLVGASPVEALFRTSSVNFNFNKSQFPLPSYKFSGEARTGIDDRFIKLLEPNGSISEGKYYSKRSDVQPTRFEGETEDVYYRRYTYENVPIIVHTKNITKTFLNPTNMKDGKPIDSFLPNDYYSTSEQINKSVEDSWKPVLDEFTNRDTFNPEYKSFYLKTQPANRSITIPTENVDKRLQTIKGNDFVILMNYVVDIYQSNNPDDPSQIIYLPAKDTAAISSISNIFPAYFVDLYGKDLFKQIKAEEGQPYVFNTNAIIEKNNILLNLLNRSSAEGRKVNLEELNQESKNLLSFLSYMFGNDNKEATTGDFIHCFDPIES